jgi:hypothetical protein
MIKIFPESLDSNYPGASNIYGAGSQMFVKDLITYCPEHFTAAHSIESSDCLIISQYSNYVHAPYVFDRTKADYIAKIKKPIVIENTGGGLPALWRNSEAGEYIWGGFADLIKVFFSVECYAWHREEMPQGINYTPIDFIGYTEMGLGLREVPPMQSKEEYLRRTIDTSVAINVYPPTRNILWSILDSNPGWNSFHFRTHYAHENPVSRIGWGEMADAMRNSKISFAPDGATAKTERHLFAPAFAAMMMQEDSVEFPYKWVDGHNCIKMEHDFIEEYEREKENEYRQNGHNLRVLNKEKTKSKIMEWLNKPDELYEVYCSGYETAKQYELPNYNKNHIGETIKKCL